jgi:hypothetical protein
MVVPGAAVSHLLQLCDPESALPAARTVDTAIGIFRTSINIQHKSHALGIQRASARSDAGLNVVDAVRRDDGDAPVPGSDAELTARFERDASPGH